MSIFISVSITRNLQSSLVTGSHLTPASSGSGVGFPYFTKLLHLDIFGESLFYNLDTSSHGRHCKRDTTVLRIEGVVLSILVVPLEVELI